MKMAHYHGNYQVRPNFIKKIDQRICCPRTPKYYT